MAKSKVSSKKKIELQKKKQESLSESNEGKIIFLKGSAARRCKKEGCLGNPPDSLLQKTENVEPYVRVDICKECWLVVRYTPTPEQLAKMKKNKKPKQEQINFENL